MYGVEAHEFINEQLKESQKNYYSWCTTNLPAKYHGNQNLIICPLNGDRQTHRHIDQVL